MKINKILFMVYLMCINSAHALDWNKTCDITSRFVAPYYSFNYDWTLSLYLETSPNSNERLRRIAEQREYFEQLLDDVSKSLTSLDSTDRFVIISIYKSSIAHMDLMSTEDAMPTKKLKQPKDRVERKLFENCVRSR